MKAARVSESGAVTVPHLEDRVKIAGIKVGTVTAVSETDDWKIRFDMRLDTAWADLHDWG